MTEHARQDGGELTGGRKVHDTAEEYEARLAVLGLEPLGTWWLPEVRATGTALRLLGAAELVLDGGAEFLLAFAGPYAEGRTGRAWRRVRLRDADPARALTALLTGTPPDTDDPDTAPDSEGPGPDTGTATAAGTDPRALLLARCDGETVAGTVETPDGPRLLLLDGISGRIETAAEAAAADRTAPGEVWEEFLAAPDPAAKVREAWVGGVAGHPATPEDLRHELLKSSPRHLWRLPRAERVEAALAHPDPKVRLQAAEWGADLTPADWSRLAATAGTPRELWIIATLAVDSRVVLEAPLAARLATDTATRTRVEAARLAELPLPQIRTLAADPAPTVRSALCGAAWPRLPQELREALLADPAAAVRTAALRWHHTDTPLTEEVHARGELPARALSECFLHPDLVTRLIEDGDVEQRVALAANPHLDPASVARLGTDPEPRVRRVVVDRPDITEEQRAHLTVDIDPGTLSHTLPWVAELHDDPEAMRRLAGSTHLLIRRSVARAPSLPRDVALRLAHDPDRVVQLFLAESCADAPAEMLLRVWTWWTGSLSAPGRPRTHPNFPREGLLRFADDLHGRMRRLALDDPLSTAGLVARFSRDPDPEVRLDAARDPRLAAADAARLAEDPDSSVRFAARANGRLPARILAGFLRDPEGAEAAVRNPAIPPAVLRAMAVRAVPTAPAESPARNARPVP
ncbi:PE-PGRS family protein [Streptomyces sp. NPDC097619]|uniref:PE-PGRS family protein n=1 Tax=Streptomyces sp. NPDC097619 TaxID=3157228 RepID=UPI00332D3FC7